MRKLKFSTLVFWVAVISGLVYGAVYFAGRPEAGVVICNSALPKIELEFVAKEIIQEGNSQKELVKFKTVASQDGRVEIAVVGGNVFGPSSMMVDQEKEVFWYVIPSVDTVEVKASITNACGTSFVQKHSQ